MPLVAMTREMGSLGMDVAKIVATELKIPVVYHEIIDHLADKMRLRRSHVKQLLDGKASLFDRLTADQTSMSIYTTDEMLQLASEGAVMRGWGAAQLLTPIKHAIRVRVCAPMELRVRRMMERLKSDDRDAVTAEIERSDEAQDAIVKRHFGVDWRDPAGYDLSLNTERVSVEQCADEILRLAKRPEFRETEESRTALLDLTLIAKTRAALRADPATRSTSVVVGASAGMVRLEGVVPGRNELKAVERVVKSVPGIKSLKNELRATSEIHTPMGD